MDEKAQERIKTIHREADVVVFDTSQGFTKYQIDLIRLDQNKLSSSAGSWRECRS